MSIRDSIADRVKTGNLSEFLLEDPEWVGNYPGIWEILARQVWKGQQIQSGRLVIYCENEKVFLCLCDKESRQICFCAGDSVSEALESLERQLQSGKADWRKDSRSKWDQKRT